MNLSSQIVGFIFLALSATTASAATFGLHTVSKHGKEHFDRVADGEVQERVKYNNQNGGVYYVADSGFTVGTYKNSYYHTTVYAGWTLYGPSLGPVGTGLTAILATGYSRNIGYGRLRPMAMPSLSVSLPADFRIRYTAAPAKKGFFQHVTIERGF